MAIPVPDSYPKSENVSFHLLHKKCGSRVRNQSSKALALEPLGEHLEALSLLGQGQAKGINEDSTRANLGRFR